MCLFDNVVDNGHLVCLNLCNTFRVVT